MFCFRFHEKETSVAVENIVAVCEWGNGCQIYVSRSEEPFNCDEDYLTVKKRYAVALKDMEAHRTAINKQSMPVAQSAIETPF